MWQGRDSEDLVEVGCWFGGKDVIFVLEFEGGAQMFGGIKHFRPLTLVVFCFLLKSCGVEAGLFQVFCYLDKVCSYFFHGGLGGVGVGVGVGVGTGVSVGVGVGS